MPFSGGMDVRARDCHVCVIDAELSLLVQGKVRNDLSRVLTRIEPFQETLQRVAEGTVTWSRLVDGRQEAGDQVCLAHTLGL